jgi:hypothetical protein
MLPANLWCSECRVYYNPRSGKHVCHKAAIDKNRADLERWLTEFTIKED